MAGFPVPRRYIVRAAAAGAERDARPASVAVAGARGSVINHFGSTGTFARVLWAWGCRNQRRLMGSEHRQRPLTFCAVPKLRTR